MKRILVTGGMGFIGHHLVEHIHRKTDWEIVIIDKLDYSSNSLDRIRSNGLIRSDRIKILTWDLNVEMSVGICNEIGDVNYIAHLAAETHVDNSIKTPKKFILNNITSLLNVLEYTRTLEKLEKFIYFSTDEVYGNADEGQDFKEEDYHKPTNPYSASKSASEKICLSYMNTYKTPLIIMNCMNAFGERQHIEKFIPHVINSILKTREILIHANKDCTKSGSRFYIHARNISDAVLFILEKGSIGECYNISGSKEVSNLDIVLMIGKILDINPQYKLVNFHEDRPGHDLRYSLDGDKMAKLGWKPPVDFEQSLERCVKWMVKNKKWLE